MMGGERQKQTTWWCLTADGVHYPTKDEAEYPKLLCQRVAAL